ncbi:DUF3426 domain-containing protein [Marinomonas agarivorans]|nr:DUF3426 domain-containing protein [Marinomonas agarivorans]
MSDSIITQCPNCSTTFRVSDEVLKMAKGKVRCGQCFHIFAAQPHESNDGNNSLKHTPVTDSTNKGLTSNTSVTNTKKEPIEPPSPPEWLDVLVESENKAVDESELEHLTPYQKRVLAERKQQQEQAQISQPVIKSEKAAWEIELEELEEMQKSAAKKTPPLTEKSKAKTKDAEKKVVIEKAPSITPETTPLPSIESLSQAALQEKNAGHEHTHPEYMQALQQLAQINNADPSVRNQYQRDAQQKLSELMEDSPTPAEAPKPKRHTFFWFTTSVMACLLLAVQLLYFNFETGSRSANFRPIYKIVCSYYKCELPVFEDVKSIDIQYVRVQSHPTQSNALLVNAIMTNTSPFSQPMPKLALEFFDLNGNPIAARLFSQKDFLDKDFLDITYMPPNTPIHLVISIADPGATAVSHQLTPHKANTRSL